MASRLLRNTMAVTLFAVSVSLPAFAQPTLFNTGVNGAGIPLALGSADTHYTVVENANANAFVVNNQLVGTYVTSPTALWIWQTAAGTPGSVTRTFRQVFDLTGFDQTTAVITGRYAADNLASIRLNGVAVGTNSNGFNSFTNFSISTNFLSGVNTLEFLATDQGAPAALIVDQLNLTARANSVNGPEPGSLVLAGLVLSGFLIRRRAR